MALRTLLLALGVVEVLKPRELVDFWMGVAVRRDESVELRDWVYTAARIEGVVIILWALTRSLRERSRSEELPVVEA